MSDTLTTILRALFINIFGVSLGTFLTCEALEKGEKVKNIAGLIALTCFIAFSIAFFVAIFRSIQ